MESLHESSADADENGSIKLLFISEALKTQHCVWSHDSSWQKLEIDMPSSIPPSALQVFTEHLLCDMHWLTLQV